MIYFLYEWSLEIYFLHSDLPIYHEKKTAGDMNFIINNLVNNLDEHG